MILTVDGGEINRNNTLVEVTEVQSAKSCTMTTLLNEVIVIVKIKKVVTLGLVAVVISSLWKTSL